MSIERDQYLRHIPYCATRVSLVDQYSWPEKDTTQPVCANGLSHPIYACNGVVSRFLPLDMYPPRDGIHPGIRPSILPRFGAREPSVAKHVERMQMDRAEGRLEGIYL